MTGLSVLLQSNALKQALQPYTLSGPWGRLLDAQTERLGEADVQAFQTEGLIGAGAAPAVLSYLFHRIKDRFDGRPTLLIVDEGWLALDDPGFAAQSRSAFVRPRLLEIVRAPSPPRLTRCRPVWAARRALPASMLDF